MNSLQQTNRLFALTNNNIQRKQLTAQGILPQSLSGSDTDVSTSNENLSTEERYVIRHTARQEPQGQENQQSSPSRSSSHKENIPNIQGNLIHRNSLKDNLNGSNRNSLKENLNGSNRNSLKDSINGSNRNSLKDNLSNRTSVGSNRSSLDISTSSYNTLIIHNANDENAWSTTGRLSNIVREHNDIGYLYCDGNSGKEYSNSPKQSLTSLSNDEKFYGPSNNSGCQEITDIPDDYLSQSQVLKHLAKEVKPTYSKLPTSCATSLEIRMRGNDGGKRTSNKFTEQPLLTYSTLLSIKNKRYPLRRTEKFIFSQSQPDLSRIDKFDNESCNSPAISPRPQTKGCEEIETTVGEIWPASEMFQFAIQENSDLKLELERCYNKVAKSQKLEQEISKVHRAHEELAASCERREKLERAARLKLQNDCRRLTELNRAFRDQIEILSSRSDNPPIVESMRKELTQRELLIGQLITQNKELAAAKERQEIELAAQRATLQEQRTHIDILDTALTNAQGNVVRLEEENRKKQVYVDRVGQLQRALSSLQASSDRREETERHLRGQLERELREGGSGFCANEQSFNGETIAEFKRRVRERDEKIMSLEGDVAKWEQRYLEESALRQAAIDAASLPKDAKIAALEKTSQDTEKMIAEARSEKIRHMDEVHAAQKKLADLESRMKDLESKLAEKDAMIRVLQKHTYDKDKSSSNGVGSYPPVHSTHSTTSADLTNTSELVARISSVSSVLGGAGSYGSASSYGVSYNYRKQGSFEQTNKSLDDQLKALDSQLLSKRALCCFPGFSNPGIASRKGKISKPLLAGVDGTGCSSTASSKSPLLNDSSIDQSGIMEFATASTKFQDAVSRLSDGKPEDMMLLEKQGRSSQQQRMQEGEQRRAGSLPPSSLPRPPRSLKSISSSRYCRLSDTETRKKSDLGPNIDTSIKITSSALEYGKYNIKGLQKKKSDVTFLNNSVKKQSCSEYERFGEIERKKQGIIIDVKHRETQNRSLIPPPRRIGEYGRLSDVDAKMTFTKQALLRRGLSTGSTVSSKSGGHDSEGTASSGASMLSLPTKVRSMPRPNYRIQF